MRDIGKNIRELRVKKSMTQDELAENLFVTRQTVSNYETGKSRPDIDMLINIAKVLDCDINHVLYGAARDLENKQNLYGFIMGVLLTVLSGLPFLFWVELHKMARHWQSGVTITLRTIVQPFFLIMLGWTFMCAIELLCHTKPLKFKYSKHVHRIIFALILIYFTIHLPACYHYIKAHKVYTWFQTLSVIRRPYSLLESFRLQPHWLNMLLGNVWLISYQNKWLFFTGGVLVCLFKDNVKKIKIHIAAILAAIILSVILFFTSDSIFTIEVINPEDYPEAPYGIVVEQWTDE